MNPYRTTLKKAIEGSRRECLKILGLGLMASGFGGAGCSRSSEQPKMIPDPNTEPTEPQDSADTVDTSVDSGGSDTVQVECPNSTMQMPLAEYPELAMVGGSATVSFPGELVHLLVVCVGHQEWIAVWKICTHGSCDVEWSEERALIECPCHNSLFDWDGAVLQGPATRPLASFGVCLDDNGEVLIVSRTE